jgi:hypothetical protein
MERQGSQYMPQRNEQEQATYVAQAAANARLAESLATGSAPKLSMQEESGDVEDADCETHSTNTRARLRELGHDIDDESDEE